MGYWKYTKYTKYNCPSITVRKHHNRVKFEILGSIVKSGDKILDLCGGRGVDIYKYIHLSASYVYYVDIDKEAIQNALGTYIKLHNPNFLMHFSKLDINSAELVHEIVRKSNNSKFDVVIIQMAIHYFLRDDTQIFNLISKITRLLKYGGKIVISGVDGARLHKTFQINGSPVTIKDERDNEIANYTALYRNDILLNTGQLIDVYITSIGYRHKEYLINFNFLLRLFEYFGIKTIQDKYFNQFYNSSMDQVTHKMSELHRIVVLEYI